MSPYSKFLISVIVLFRVATCDPAFADFGLSSSEKQFRVDTGAGLVFSVNRSNGDVTSWNFNGVEHRYDDRKRASHINSGLGDKTNVMAEMVSRDLIKITIKTDGDNKVAKDLTHYLIVRKGENNVYMATYVTDPLPRGELRWITRLWAPRLSRGPVPSDVRDNEGPAESSDVFRMKNGRTRSKYFGDEKTHGKDRAIDLTFCGARGKRVGIWMVYGNRESSSGGPFFRDIQNQCDSSQQIYNYMYSGHNQTEEWRTDALHGPYALVFTRGRKPKLPIDYSWIDSAGLNLKGWVSEIKTRVSVRECDKKKSGGKKSGGQAICLSINESAFYSDQLDTIYSTLVCPPTLDVSPRVCPGTNKWPVPLPPPATSWHQKTGLSPRGFKKLACPPEVALGSVQVPFVFLGQCKYPIAIASKVPDWFVSNTIFGSCFQLLVNRCGNFKRCFGHNVDFIFRRFAIEICTDVYPGRLFIHNDALHVSRYQSCKLLVCF